LVEHIREALKFAGFGLTAITTAFWVYMVALACAQGMGSIAFELGVLAAGTGTGWFLVGLQTTLPTNED
jgi:hypothetical protein